MCVCVCVCERAGRGGAQLEAAVNAMREGAYDFVEKPLKRLAIVKYVTFAFQNALLFACFMFGPEEWFSLLCLWVFRLNVIDERNRFGNRISLNSLSLLLR